jgi:hypothetical protein
LAVGTYWCLAKGDWSRGLPALARGSDANLKAAAAKELDVPTSPAGQVEVAELWAKLADTNVAGYKASLQSHAKEWYQKALPQLSGLEKAKIEKRLAAMMDGNWGQTERGSSVDDVLAEMRDMAMTEIKKQLARANIKLNTIERKALNAARDKYIVANDATLRAAAIKKLAIVPEESETGVDLAALGLI